MAYTWFFRKDLFADPDLPSSYNPQPSCSGTEKVCAIYAEVDQSTGLPVINRPITEEMIRALDSSSSTSSVKLTDAPTYTWFIRRCGGNNDVVSPESYELTNGQPSCSGTEKVCAIYVQVDQSTGMPVINKAMADEMARALDSSSDRVTVLLADY